MKSLTLAIALLAAPASADPVTHDGLYVRLGVGPGYSVGWLSSDAPSNRSTGVDISTELAIGWTVRPGLVIGGGTFPMIVPSPSYHGVDAGGQHVSGTGVFVDNYLDPDRGGLHVQGGLLFTLGYLDDVNRGTVVGAGVGATVGIGYERFVTDRWAVGGIARVTAYELWGVGNSLAIVAPSLLVAVTRR